MTLGTEDGLVQAILKPRAVGRAGEVVVVGKIAYMINQSLLLGDVAAGDGDPVAKLDDLDVDPGCLNHVVVDEDFAGKRYTGSDDLPITFDKSGGDHKGANLSEDLSKQTLATGVQPALRVGVDIVETKIDNLA